MNSQLDDHGFRVGLVMLILIAGISFLACAPGHASAAGTGSISGNVSGGAIGGRLILAGPCVQAYDAGGNPLGVVRADSNGNYKVANLSSGDYRLEIIDCAARLGPEPSPGACAGAAAINCFLPGVPSEFYDNKTSLDTATLISVIDGVETTGINAQLPSPANNNNGAITGTVTGNSGSLDGICVDVYDSDGTPSGKDVSGTDSPAGFLHGHYQVNGLPPGSYRLKFSDCQHADDPSVSTQFYNAKTTLADAQSVVVTSGDTTSGIDVRMVAKQTGPTVRKATISKVAVKGPAKVRKGKKLTPKVTITNSGNADATDVVLKVKGKGVNLKISVGSIPAASSRTVQAGLKPKKAGKAKLTFKVTSANAGGKSVERGITVEK